MPSYNFDIQQNSEEWYDIKLGKFSASTADDLLMAKGNKGYQNLINKIVEERITGKPCESRAWSGNVFTERGHELEPVAREDFEIRNFVDIQIVGVVELDDWVLCSPDGLIDNDGLYQAKCPIFATQRKYLIDRKIPGNYQKQLQFELYVTEREYNYYNCYHPSLPPLDIKVYRDEKMIKEIHQRITEAKEEVLREIEFLKKLSF